MIESRAIIKSIKKTRTSVEKLSARFKGNYAFNDIIFIPRKKKHNLNKNFMRMRIYIRNNWPTKKIVLMRKKTEWKKSGKNSRNLLKKEFNTEKEAVAFLNHNFPQFKKAFEYSREGWEYELDKGRIFVEAIEGLPHSVEIEVADEETLKLISRKLKIKKSIKSSVPEMVSKRLNQIL